MSKYTTNAAALAAAPAPPEGFDVPNPFDN